MQQMGGHSNGFYGGPVKDEYQAPIQGTYKSGLSFPIAMYIPSPADKTIATLVFKYRTYGSFNKIWLEFKTIPTTYPLRVLVDSELLRNNYPPAVSYNGVMLFQKNPQYNSVEQFIAHPPQATTMIDDSLLVQLSANNIIIPSAQVAEQWYSTTDFPDYWLTRFTKPRMFPDDWYETGVTLDMSNVIRESDGSIKIMLYADNMAVHIDMTNPSVSWRY
jgi:hypothetical protein